MYFLTELIRGEKDRVNIEEQEDYETDPEKITGGWLVDSVYTYAEEFANLITAAAKNDAERWKDKGYGNKDMSNRLKRIKERLQQTENWLVKQWGEGKATSVENVETGLSSEAVYYNLQGMRVEKPVKGQVYIQVQGGKSKKVMM